MPQRVLFKRLKFAYGSAATIIGVLILLAQIVIQSALYQEVATRNLASTMSLQELHSQHFLRNALMSFDPSNMTINPLKINPSQQIGSDLTFLEATNKRLIDISQTPQPIVDQIEKVQSDFVIMDQAGHQLLIDVKNHNKTNQSKQVQSIFIYEQAYLTGVYMAFVSLTQQADGYVNNVRLLEITLCFITILTILIEVFYVVIPAFKDYQKALDDLEQAMLRKQTTVQQSGDIAPTS